MSSSYSLYLRRLIFAVFIFSLSSCSIKQKPNIKKRYEVVYKSIASESLCENCPMRIPKIFHRVWMVWDTKNPEIPPLYKMLDYALKKHHPDWEFMEWNDNSINEFVKKYYPEFWPIFDSYDVAVKKHDAFRYLVIHHYGGVFIQHSIMVYKNLEPLLRGYDAVFSEQSIVDNTICNGFFGSVKKHKILREIIKNLPKIKDRHILQATGPYVASHFVHEYFKKNRLGNVLILSPKYLFPFDWNQKNQEPYFSSCIKSLTKCRELFPESFGYCFWSASWN